MSDHTNAFAVKMTEFDISETVLDNLASEYYGSVYASAGDGDHLEAIVEFDTETNMRLFRVALESYRKPID